MNINFLKYNILGILSIVLISCNENNSSMENQSTSDTIEKVDTNSKTENEIEEIKIVRNPEKRLDFANVFWKKAYTLFDLITDEPIFPINKNGKIVYQIYYSTNENPVANFGEFTPDELENLTCYKFKNRENCLKFCDRNSGKNANVSPKSSSSGSSSQRSEICKCDWCGDEFKGEGFNTGYDCDYIKSGRSMYQTRGGYYCSRKCALEACNNR
jgi:hypothetical protein